MLFRSADAVFEAKYCELIAEVDQAKRDVEAEKSGEDETDSFFNSIPSAVQREQQSGRSLFSDVDQ